MTSSPRVTFPYHLCWRKNCAQEGLLPRLLPHYTPAPPQSRNQLLLYKFQQEKAMAPHFSTLAWKIPWTEEPGRLQSMGSLGVGHYWATSLWLFTFMNWRRKWQPTPVFLPGESMDRGAWWAAVYGVSQSQTRLKRLSSSKFQQESANKKKKEPVKTNLAQDCRTPDFQWTLSLIIHSL